MEHLDPSSEIQLEVVKARAVRGVFVLTGRTFILNIITFIAQGFLWAFLTPAEFGIFWIVSAIVNFLIYFSDIGLAAALIQKKERPTDADLRTTFTVQQILVIFLLLVLFFASPYLARAQSLSAEGRFLMYALGVSFFLSSLKSIPSVLLERKLEFGKFIIPQVLENLVFNLVVVILAWQGWGIRSFTYAVLVRGMVGLVAIYILQPWLPRFSFSRKSLRELLRFGLPYQLNTFLAVFKDDGMTILLGSILGPAGIGILGTAQRLAQYPLRFFMDNVTKVTFPAFARMQEKKEELAHSLNRSVFFITFLVFPSMVGILVLIPLLLKVVPRYTKWEPALLPLALISVNTLFASFTTQFTNLFNAIGKIKLTFKLMLMWSLLTFLLVPLLAVKYGVVGAALGYLLVGISSVVAAFWVKRLVNFSVLETIGKPALAALVMGVLLWVLKAFLPMSIITIFVLILLGGASYLATIYLLVGSSLLTDVRKMLKLGR
jgi:O-antigen/teichoic acid export membrane protein